MEMNKSCVALAMLDKFAPLNKFYFFMGKILQVTTSFNRFQVRIFKVNFRNEAEHAPSV